MFRSESRTPGKLFGFLLILVAVLGICSVSSAASGFQFSPKLNVSTDQRSYAGNATIVVSGSITEVQGYVIVTIANPSGSPIASAYGDIDEYSGLYQAEIRAGGQGWAESGKYNVTVTWQFCPTTVTNSTTFAYTAIPASQKNNQFASSTRLTATVTRCDSSTTSATSILGKPASSATQIGDTLLSTGVLPVVVAALVSVLLVTAAIAVRLRGRQKTV